MVLLSIAHYAADLPACSTEIPQRLRRTSLRRPRASLEIFFFISAEDKPVRILYDRFQCYVYNVYTGHSSNTFKLLCRDPGSLPHDAHTAGISDIPAASADHG